MIGVSVCTHEVGDAIGNGRDQKSIKFNLEIMNELIGLPQEIQLYILISELVIKSVIVVG